VQVQRQDKYQAQVDKMHQMGQQACSRLANPKTSPPTWMISSMDFHHLACLVKL
jgi:hypothetical protein